MKNTPCPGPGFAFCSPPLFTGCMVWAVAALSVLCLERSLRAQPITLQSVRGSNGMVFSWNAAKGALYHLQTTTNLSAANWTLLAPLYADGGTLQWTDFNPADQTRFYRVLQPDAQPASVEPAVSTAYSQINLHGYNFDPSEQITVGGVPLATLFVDSTLLQATLPNLALGYYDVQLSVHGGIVAVVTNGIQVVASGSLALRVEPPGPTPGDPACTACSRGAQNDPLGLLLFSGEVKSTATDLSIPGVGLDFVWSRCHRTVLGANTSQGNGWTFGYNIFIQASGSNLLLTDGNGRHDLYLRQADGTYRTAGFMRQGSFDNQGNFTLTFPDAGQWVFFPLDGSARGGKLASIQDRNGNTMFFAYDSANGRLLTVVDTLGRPISLSYDWDGFLSSITDFSGRVVAYTYYGGGEAGGSFGDLKAVTSPPVIGTPNGNDFPAGKTTTYTYTRDNPDPNLNHKLLTISDPKGQTYLRNVYSTSTDPAAPDYGRVVSRVLGETNEILCFAYSTQTPTPGNHFATQKTIVNDRVGNVTEYFYDSQNRTVMERKFTGRAVPGLTTTDTANRPTGKLRATDPDYFETSYAYDADSLPTLITYPNGNLTRKYYEADYHPGASQRSRANLRLEQHLPGPLGGAQPALVWQYEYDTDKSGCCGFNFVTRLTDPQGNVTQHSYDAQGNRIHTAFGLASVVEDFTYNARGQMTAHVLPDNGQLRRWDAFVYYTNGPQNGCLRQSVVDSTNLALTTAFEYDAVGNLVRTIDARGNDSTRVVNALNQTVRQVSRQVTNQFGAFRYVRDITYDANDNVVQTDTLNLDDQGAVQPNAYFTTTTTYDLLNYPVAVSREVEAAHNTVTQYAYDGNRNRVQVIQGAATSGADPFNTLTTLYDERGLPYQEIRAPGSGDQSTTQYDYDLNGNLVATRQGLEDSASPRVTTYTWDGYDRRTTLTDPQGNSTTVRYDAAGNVVSQRVDGEGGDLPGGTNRARLEQTDYTYDAMNREVVRDRAVFDLATGTNLVGGQAVTRTVYSGNSQVLQTIDANNHTNITAYDSAYRRSRFTDAQGNTTSYTYDANHNLTLQTEVDLPDLGGGAQTFRTSHQYDQEDRLIQTTDNAGDTTRWTYDSRSHRVSLTDPRGNLTRYAYDGLGRPTTTTRVLTDDGTGGGVATNSILTSQSWDDSSRLTSQTDPSSNTTTYVYDSLDRLSTTIFADGTTNRAAYDVHDNKVTAVDANGSVISATYDLNNRVISKTITRTAVSVSGTTFEKYQYDGLGHAVRAENDDSLVLRGYDSLSRMVRETQQITSSGAPPRSVAWTYDGVGNVRACTYPGGRVIGCTYDASNRQQVNADASGTNATYKYFGAAHGQPLGLVNAAAAACGYDPVRRLTNHNIFGGLGGARVQQLTYGNGVAAAYGYDPVRRLTNHSVFAGSAPVDSRLYAWDTANNLTASRDLLAPTGDDRRFNYDSANRLVASSAAATGATVAYTLDGVGNRVKVTGGTNAGNYALAAGTDFVMNQYTTTPADSRTYDPNGNLVIAAGNGPPPYFWTFTYDYLNRLVGFMNLVGGYGTAKYDCFGRRIEKSSPGMTTRYYYSGWQVIEEQNATNGTAATYVWGNGVDELLTMTRGGQKYFFHADQLGSIRKVTDANQNVVEQYLYDDFGAPTFLSGSGKPLSASQIGNATLFTGRTYDAETGLYDYRTRYLDTAMGRFTTRDAIGIWGDLNNLGNAYAYVGNRPLAATDPFGDTAIDEKGLLAGGKFGEGKGGVPKGGACSPAKVVTGGGTGRIGGGASAFSAGPPGQPGRPSTPNLNPYQPGCRPHNSTLSACEGPRWTMVSGSATIGNPFTGGQPQNLIICSYGNAGPMQWWSQCCLWFVESPNPDGSTFGGCVFSTGPSLQSVLPN